MTKLVGASREKLLVALLAEDITNALNLVCKVRGIKFRLEWKDVLPRLWISRPGVEEELLMESNPRTRKSNFFFPMNQELHLAVGDLVTRLHKMDSRLMLVTMKHNQRRYAKLQVHVAGSKSIALNILEIPRKGEIIDNEFKLPEPIK